MLTIKIYCLKFGLKIWITESWLFILMTFQPNRLNQFVPGYQPKSDFIPGSRVTEVSEVDRVQILRDIDLDRQRGKVLNTPPPGFNPSRYQSFQVYENVNTNTRIPASQMGPVPVQPKFYD